MSNQILQAGGQTVTYLLMLAQWMVAGNISPNEVTRKCYARVFKQLEGHNFLVFDGFWL